MIRDWLDAYREAVTQINSRGLSGDSDADLSLRTLCPVTWKTLELAFAHRLFAHLPHRRGRRGPAAP